MPNATVSMLEDSGHMVPYEAPERLATLVADWLASTA
jgi:carboxypeptidase C (cathepsin A)